MVDQANTEGRTALWVAAHEGRVEVIKVLLEAGADISHKANNGHTPLAVAHLLRVHGDARAMHVQHAAEHRDVILRGVGRGRASAVHHPPAALRGAVVTHLHSSVRCGWSQPLSVISHHSHHTQPVLS